MSQGDLEYLIQNFLEPIADFLRDPSVSDIVIYGPDCIAIKQIGKPLSRVERAFESVRNLQSVCKQIARYINRPLDGEDNLILDARLPTGERVNIVLAPVYLNGAAITIRKPTMLKADGEVTLAKIRSFKTLNQDIEDILGLLIALKKNIIISGGTGTGKTTMLNGIAGLIADDEIVISIEDDREIYLKKPFWCAMESRHAIYKEQAEISLSDLVKNALRQYPKWILLGECRGREVLDLLNACNTGHAGLSTIHASSAERTLTAIETKLIQAVQMPIGDRRQLISTSIDIVVHMRLYPDNIIRIAEIVEIAGFSMETDLPTYKLNTLAKFDYKKFDQGIVEGDFCVVNPPTFVNEFNYLSVEQIPKFWRNLKEGGF